jgi:hypothetical protein
MDASEADVAVLEWQLDSSHSDALSDTEVAHTVSVDTGEEYDPV